MAVRLLEIMIYRMEQRRSCAEELLKLSREMGILRGDFDFATQYGIILSVVGGACLIGARIIRFTDIEDTIIVGSVGAGLVGIGVIGTWITKSLDHSKTSSNLKKAEEIEEQSERIAKEIKRLTKQLKAKGISFENLEELDRDNIITLQIAGESVRRNAESSLQKLINFLPFNH